MHFLLASLLAAMLSSLILPGAVATPRQQASPASAPNLDPQQDTQAGAAPSTQSPQQGEITAVPNRPTFASTAESVQRGVFELEYGFEATKGHQNINGLLKWGLLKNLELWFLNVPLERDSAVAGRGDSGAGFKYRVISQSNKIPSIAVLYVATLPTATAQLGAGAFGHSVQVLFSKDFGQHHFDVNEGVQLVGRPAATGFDRNYFSALSYSHPISGKWGWTAELAGFSWTNASMPATMTLLAAGTYNLKSRLVLDGGAYFRIYGNLPRVTVFSGVTYSVADLYNLRSSRRTAAKH